MTPIRPIRAPLALLLAASALATIAAPAHAAETGFHEEARVGMSEAEFLRANHELFGSGHRLVDITVAESGGKPVVGAIWYRYEGMPAPTPERTKQQVARVFLKLDEAKLRDSAQTFAAQGSAIEVLDAYRAGGKTWFAVSFAPPKEPTMQTIGGMLTPEEADGMRDQAHQHNSDLARLDVFGESDDARYIPVYVQRGQADIDQRDYESTMEILADGVSMHLLDYQPLSISVYEFKGKTRWFALWDKGEPRDLLLTESADAVRRRIASGGGGRVLDLDSQAGDDGKVLYYAVVTGGKKDG